MPFFTKSPKGSFLNLLIQKAVISLRSIPKRTWIGMAIAIGLWWIFMHYTRWPAVQQKSDILTVLASGAPNTFNELVSREGWPYWLSWIPTGINMNDNNAIGMAFAFLIGGAVSSLLLPQNIIKKILNARGTKGSSLGGLLGAPLMMCSACSVPVAIGWKKRGANLETTLGVVMGAALLNIMGLMTIFILFPSGLAWGRVLASLMLVIIITPLTVSFYHWLSNSQKDYLPTSSYLSQKMGPASQSCSTDPTASSVEETWVEAFISAIKGWWTNSVEIAYRLFLPMTGAIFLAAFIRLFIPPEIVESYLGGGWLAIVIVAAFGTFIAVPTLFEIPLTMGFLFLGMGLGPASALLITAPSVSIVSYYMLKKDVGHIPPLLLMAVTFIFGVAVGLIIESGGL